MMQKQLILIMAPVNTVSGYGARSRDIAHAIIASDKYDVLIWPTRWGNTPQNYLNDQDPTDKLLLDRCLSNPQLPKQPDVFIQITVPNEFQQIGRLNIGITAGIETTIASAPWIEGCNRMDLVLTSSEHSKKVLEESIWEKVDQQTNQPDGVLKLEKPVEVLFEGVDLTKYFKTNEIHQSVDEQLTQVKEDFAFLFVGHWLKGDLGEDRKNISGLIKVFLETFKNKGTTNRPALVLKTSSSDFSPLDREDIVLRIQQVYQTVQKGVGELPNVYFIHGDLTDEEMNSLYNHPKIKAHVTLTKGEGFGRPLAEASLSEKVIIAPNWSGQMDFLKHSIQVAGNLTQVHPSAAWEEVILQESQWFTADYAQASEALKYAYDKKNAKTLAMLGKRQASVIKREFSFENMQEALLQYIDKQVASIPQVKLPTLKKIELPKLKKVENEQ
jgi:glycosyltransferase involved in cell wall biosynthesis